MIFLFVGVWDTGVYRFMIPLRGIRLAKELNRTTVLLLVGMQYSYIMGRR